MTDLGISLNNTILVTAHHQYIGSYALRIQYSCVVIYVNISPYMLLTFYSFIIKCDQFPTGWAVDDRLVLRNC